MTDSTQHPETTPHGPDSADTRPLDVRFPQDSTAPDSTAPLPRASTPLPDAAPPADQAPPADHAPSTAPAHPAARRPPVRMSTVIWGLVVVVVGVGVVARAQGADFDNELALIVLLGAAGVALVATSIVSAVRRR